MLGALICEYWGMGVLIRGNWVSLYSTHGHALIFGTKLIYEKLENYPFSAYKGMSLYAGQYGNNNAGNNNNKIIIMIMVIMIISFYI